MIPLRIRSDDRRILRIARLLPLLISAFELRYVLVRAVDVLPDLHRTEQAYMHSVVPWIVTLLACGAAWMLREAARGLAARITPPRWSAALLGMWLVSCVALVAVLGGQELCRELVALGHGGRPPTLLSSAVWSSIPVAVLVGLVLAASLQGARWILCEIRRRRGRSPFRRHQAAGTVPIFVCVRAMSGPLLAGWSDRGPPVRPALLTA